MPKDRATGSARSKSGSKASRSVKLKRRGKGRRKPSPPITGPLATTPNPTNKKRLRNIGPHVGQTDTQRLYAELEAEWTTNLRWWGYYGEPRQRREKPYSVDGKKVVEDLHRWYRISLDPSFLAAIHSAIAMGVVSGGKLGNAKRIWQAVHHISYFTPQYVEEELRRGAGRLGRVMKLSEAAAIVCARIGFPGNSGNATFDSARAAIEDRYRDYVKAGHPPTEDAFPTDTGQWLHALPHSKDRYDLGTAGQIVPDTVLWRRRQKNGEVFTRHLNAAENQRENDHHKSSETEILDQTS
jgi:hypothetical protein